MDRVAIASMKKIERLVGVGVGETHLPGRTKEGHGHGAY